MNTCYPKRTQPHRILIGKWKKWGCFSCENSNLAVAFFDYLIIIFWDIEIFLTCVKNTIDSEISLFIIELCVLKFKCIKTSSLDQFYSSHAQSIIFLSDDDPPESLEIRKQLHTHWLLSLYFDLGAVIAPYRLRVLLYDGPVIRVEDEVDLGYPRWRTTCSRVQNHLGPS